MSEEFKPGAEDVHEVAQEKSEGKEPMHADLRSFLKTESVTLADSSEMEIFSDFGRMDSGSFAFHDPSDPTNIIFKSGDGSLKQCYIDTSRIDGLKDQFIEPQVGQGQAERDIICARIRILLAPLGFNLSQEMYWFYSKLNEIRQRNPETKKAKDEFEF